MKKKVISVGMIAVLLSGWLSCVNVFAATLKIETATDTVAVGGEVVVNLSSEGADSDDPAIKLSYDSSFLTLTGCSEEYSDEGGVVTVNASSAKLTFDGKADGIAKIKAEGAISADGSVTNAEAQISVGTGAAVTQAGGESSQLKTLDIKPGNMNPAFSPEVTAYTVDVSEDTELVNVTCSLRDSNAKVVSASGFKNLKKGTNQASIVVQGTDGTKTTYNIAINRGAATESVKTEAATGTDTAAADTTDTTAKAVDAAFSSDTGFNIGAADGTAVEGSASTETVAPNPDGTITVGGDSIYAPFLVHPTFDVEVPAGFLKENYTYKGNNVESAYFAQGGIRLLYLTAADGGNAAFRIYYIDTDTFMDFYPITGKEGTFIFPVRFEAQVKVPYNYTGTYLPLDTTVIPAHIYTELTGRTVIGGEGEQTEEEIQKALEENQDPVDVSELDEEPEFYLIYAMNQNGTEGFYLYDIVEGTYQRYVERDTSYDLDQSYFKYKKVAHTRFAIMCTLGVLLLIAIFVIINLALKNKDLKYELGDDEGGIDEKEEKRKRAEKEREERRKERRAREAEKEKEEEVDDLEDLSDEFGAVKTEHRKVTRSERYGALASASDDDLNLEDDEDDDMTIPPARTVRTQTGTITGVPQTTAPIPRTTGTIPRTTGTIQRTTGTIPRTAGTISGVSGATGSVRKPVTTSTGSIYNTNTNIILPDTTDDDIKIARPVVSRESDRKGIARQVTPGATAQRTTPDIYEVSEEESISQGSAKTGVTGPIREARQIKEQARKTRTVRPNPKRESSFTMINLARESEDILDDDFEFDFLNPDEED